ncbi:unnamed protein product [Lampetra fluviatilis]
MISSPEVDSASMTYFARRVNAHAGQPRRGAGPGRTACQRHAATGSLPAVDTSVCSLSRGVGGSPHGWRETACPWDGEEQPRPGIRAITVTDSIKQRQSARSRQPFHGPPIRKLQMSCRAEAGGWQGTAAAAAAPPFPPREDLLAVIISTYLGDPRRVQIQIPRALCLAWN